MFKKTLNKSKYTNLLQIWTRSEKVSYLILSSILILMTYIICFYGKRSLFFDEIGLHNPIYTFLTTGHMTYPLHGFKDFMIVHPPTHYAMIALLMKICGMELFPAANLLIMIQFVSIICLLYFARLQFIFAISCLLGTYLAIFIWGHFAPVRPDLDVTLVWFSSLIAFQGAQKRNWNIYWLGLGSALAVFASTIHYWAIISLCTPIIYFFIILFTRHLSFRNIIPQLSAIVLGALVVGIPFLIIVVIPYFEPMMGMIRGVQTTGTPSFSRHLEFYKSLAHMMPTYNYFFSRQILDPFIYLSTHLPLNIGIPVIFFLLPIFTFFRTTRLFILIGSLLPLFVLFGSRHKSIGYTGYLMPEFLLSFVAILYLVLCFSNYAIRFIIDNFLKKFKLPFLFNRGEIIVMMLIVVLEASTSLGLKKIEFTNTLDYLELQRAAAKKIIGDDARVSLASAGIWYTSGGRYVWNAFNEGAFTNQTNPSSLVDFLTEKNNIVVFDNAWWNYHDDLLPLGKLFVNGKFHLLGFGFVTDKYNNALMQIFLSNKKEYVRGVLIDDLAVENFNEKDGGEWVFSSFACKKIPDTQKLQNLKYIYSFPYQGISGHNSPTMVLAVHKTSEASLLDTTLASPCKMFQRVNGELVKVDRAELKKTLTHEKPIEFYMTKQAFNSNTKK